VLQGGKTSGRGKAPNTQLRNGIEALGRGKVNQNPNQKLKMKEGHSGQRKPAISGVNEFSRGQKSVQGVNEG